MCKQNPTTRCTGCIKIIIIITIIFSFLSQMQVAWLQVKLFDRSKYESTTFTVLFELEKLRWKNAQQAQKMSFMRCWLLEIRTVKILSKHSVQFSVNEKFLQYAKFDQPYFVEITSHFAKMKLRLILVYFQANISTGWFNRLFFKSFWINSVLLKIIQRL